MARQIIIQLWCDADHLDPMLATATHTISIDGVAREIDLCVEHQQSLIGRLRDVMAKGVEPRGETDPCADGRCPCPHPGCGKDFKNRASLAGHVKQTHGKSIKEYQ